MYVPRSLVENSCSAFPLTVSIHEFIFNMSIFKRRNPMDRTQKGHGHYGCKPQKTLILNLPKQNSQVNLIKS